MSNDEEIIDEIRAWFDERGYDLWLHGVEDHTWRASYVPKGARIGAAAFGVGNTAREAAEDAQARYTRENAIEVSKTVTMPYESTAAVSSTATLPYESLEAKSVKIGMAVETDTAQPLTPSKTKVIGQAIDERALPAVADLPEVEKKVETLKTYGWRVLFEEEPDGKVTGHLLDEDSGEMVKTALGADFEDAWLGLAIDTKPPSQELRKERTQRRSGGER